MTQNQCEGEFIIQCKHTSISHDSLTEKDLAKEILKISLFAAKEPCHYILMTNRQVSAPGELEIRQAFEAVPGVKSCLVLSETWIEDTLDAHPRLLRLVPRLYGIGDLSQILSFTIQQQTAAVLEDLEGPLRTYVPTDSYRRAEYALSDHGFVVLVGPPASGKSAIAANLCMVNLAQDEGVRILRIEHADQFTSTWSPGDAHTIYWVDDVFGETTLDEGRLREWSVALDKIEAARKRQGRIIFCTRDYILAAAEQKLKINKADLINDARVRVDVTTLSDVEKEAILYNHIKEGNIDRDQKKGIKEFLLTLAHLPSFSPELARRLGSRRFHEGLVYESKALRDFFDRPVQHFRDVIHGLARAETAALAVCLLSGNAVPDPIPDDALADAVLATYAVSMPQVRDAMEILEGSLVKRVRQNTTQTWQLHHPSMVEALQEELASKSSQLVLYLQSARLRTIFRDTTTVESPSNSRLVFIPETVYRLLVERLFGAGSDYIGAIADYLGSRASDSFLLAVDGYSTDLVDRCLDLEPDPDGSDGGAKLVVRLVRIGGGELLGDRRKETLIEALKSSIDDYGWLGFLDINGIYEAIPDFVSEFVEREMSSGFRSIETSYDWYSQDLSSKDQVYSAVESIYAHAARLRIGLEITGHWSDSIQAILEERRRVFERRLDDYEVDDYDERYKGSGSGEWETRWNGRPPGAESGRFSDVDE
ncbi:MAG TPA: hypothetical protein VGS22_09515 [Thermoanaerobaculia bacterium]|nr:hypothetical protein [Thermoanaerobaculia bacterium]